MKDLILLVCLDLNDELLSSVEDRFVSEREETNLVQDVGRVRDKFSEKTSLFL